MSNPSNVAVMRIKPHHYIHVLNNNTNVTRVVNGPQTFTREDHEVIVAGPLPMIMIPPRSYCIIQNPHVKDKKGAPVFDQHGQIQLVFGDEEVRLESPDPFPLYPGEALVGKVTPLQVVQPNMALRLKAKRTFEDKKAGEEWLFRGPATYIPSVAVEVLEVVKSFIIKQNQALHLKAKRDCVDFDGNKRLCGEHWIYRIPGAYLPLVYEEPMETINAYILTDKKALQLEANDTFTDVRGVKRLAGEQWLVTSADAEAHIPDVYERVVGEVNVTTLSSLQYCIVVNPMKDGKNQWGKRELRKGEASFFLQPGESLESGIQNVHVLDSQEALLLRAIESFTDSDGTKRAPGTKWMIFGPCDYVPPVEVSIVERRSTIPLDENEGIYVRDMKTGKVQAIIGKSYMLSADEELWKKDVSPQVEELLMKHNSGTVSKNSTRDVTRMITYRAPHNSALQVYDYKSRTARVSFGPELVMLGPDEEFTVNSLSGGVPKQPHAIQSIALLLGPDFMTDVVVVETSDHARLSLKLSYSWHFEVDSKNPSKLFSCPDFVGDACKAIASRVRGVVAQTTFDNFHKGSAQIIRTAVFGTSPNSGEVNNRFIFTQNGLVITNIDIQSVEPVDSRTRDALQKSVQLAIEITTKSQEATARHEAERREQEARGRLERQKIEDECEAERSRVDLINLQSQSAIVEATGQATAEARARAEAAAIEGRAAVKQAELNAEAEAHKANAQLSRQKHKQETELSHKEALNNLEIQKANDLASIEVKKFKDIISAVGADTIESIATSQPTAQVALLESLGLTSQMITDGNHPVNLFATANGLISGN